MLFFFYVHISLKQCLFLECLNYESNENKERIFFFIVCIIISSKTVQLGPLFTYASSWMKLKETKHDPSYESHKEEEKLYFTQRLNQTSEANWSNIESES